MSIVARVRTLIVLSLLLAVGTTPASVRAQSPGPSASPVEPGAAPPGLGPERCERYGAAAPEAGRSGATLASLRSSSRPSSSLAIAQDGVDPIPPCEFPVLAGDVYQPFGVNVVDSWHATIDGTGDLFQRSGTAAEGAPGYLDATRLLWGTGAIPDGLRTALRQQAPAGTDYTGYGDPDHQFPNGKVLFFAVTLAQAPPARPPDGRSVHVFFGSDPNGKPGDDYAARVDAPHNPWNGIQRFTFGGAFSNGTSAAGSADMGKKGWAYYNVTIASGIVYDAGLPGWVGWVPAREVGDSFRVWVGSTAGEVTVEDIIGAPESELAQLPTDGTTLGILDGGSVFLHAGPFPKLLEITLVSGAFGAMASRPLADITLVRGRKKVAFAGVAPAPGTPSNVLRYAVRIPAAGVYTLAGLGLTAATSQGSRTGSGTLAAAALPGLVAGPPTRGAEATMDMDGDGDIDAADAAVSARAFTWSGQGFRRAYGGATADLGEAGGDLGGDHADGRTGYDPTRDHPCVLWTVESMREVAMPYVEVAQDGGARQTGTSPDGRVDYCVLYVNLAGGGQLTLGHNQENVPLTLAQFDEFGQAFGGPDCEQIPFPGLGQAAYFITCPPNVIGGLYGYYVLDTFAGNQYGSYYGINAPGLTDEQARAFASDFANEGTARVNDFDWQAC